MCEIIYIILNRAAATFRKVAGYALEENRCMHKNECHVHQCFVKTCYLAYMACMYLTVNVTNSYCNIKRGKAIYSFIYMYIITISQYSCMPSS